MQRFPHLPAAVVATLCVLFSMYLSRSTFSLLSISTPKPQTKTQQQQQVMAQQSKHALVVGASAGIGRAVALKLAPLVSKLTLSSRSCPSDLLASVKAKNPNVEVTHEFLDVSLLHDVRRFTANHVATQFDWVVLSPGIMSFKGRTETVEGLDVKMSTHYYGRFMLVNDLLAGLNRPGVRVLNVLGAGQGGAPDLDDLDLKRSFSVKRCADVTTLYSDLMTQALSEKAPQASFMHIFPGFVNTNLVDSMPWYVRGPSKGLAALLARSPEKCAANMVAALTKDEFASGWRLLNENAQEIPKTKPHTDELKQVVWDHTLRTIAGVMEQ